MPALCNACPVEFPDSSGTPLACPGATIREHDPVLEKTIPSSAINPILVYQVWARGIQQGGPISLGFTLWNEIRPKKYPSPSISFVPLWQTTCNKSFSIPLGRFAPCLFAMSYVYPVKFTIVTAKRISLGRWQLLAARTGPVFVELFYVYSCE
jgi:hypothetical protein